MPVEAGTSEFTYLGDGVTKTFPFPSRFFTDDDLSVGLNSVEQSSSTYTVTGAGSATGGSVTFTVAPAAGVKVMLLRRPEASQLVDFVNGQTILEGTLDNALDRLTMLVQYLLRLSERTIRVSDLDVSVDMILPNKADRSSKIFGFDANGKPSAVVPVPSGSGLATFDALVDATAAGKAIGRAASAAAQRILLDVYSKGETDALFTGLATDTGLAAAIANAIVAGSRITVTYAAGQFTISGPSATDLIEAGSGIAFAAGGGGKTKINNSRDLSVKSVAAAPQGSTGNAAVAYLSADGNRIYAAGAAEMTGNQIGANPAQFVQVLVDGASTKAPALPWKSIHVGVLHLFAIDSDDDVFGMGINGQGQLGIGSTTLQSALTYIPGAGKCSRVVMPKVNYRGDATFSAAYFLRLDNTLYASGPNTTGQLCDGTLVSKTTPVRCGTLTDISKVFAFSGNTGGYCYAVTSTGAAYAWGLNDIQQLGDGTAVARSTPYLTLNGVKSITSFHDFDGTVYYCSALAVMLDGSLRGIGSNTYGQLGDGTTTARTVWFVSNLTNVSAAVLVGGRGATTVALLNDGTVRTLGHNAFGACGNGGVVSPQLAAITPAGAFQGTVVDVFGLGSYTHGTVGLRTSTGAVWLCGKNGHGQIGDGTLVNKSTFSKLSLPPGEFVQQAGACGSESTAGESALFCLTSNNRLFFAGYNATGCFGTPGFAASASVKRLCEANYTM